MRKKLCKLLLVTTLIIGLSTTALAANLGQLGYLSDPLEYYNGCCSYFSDEVTIMFRYEGVSGYEAHPFGVMIINREGREISDIVREVISSCANRIPISERVIPYGAEIITFDLTIDEPLIMTFEEFQLLYSEYIDIDPLSLSPCDPIQLRTDQDCRVDNATGVCWRHYTWTWAHCLQTMVDEFRCTPRWESPATITVGSGCGRIWRPLLS